MPPWVLVRDFPAHVGEEVTVKGWLYSRRSSGKLQFLMMRDGSGMVQAVASARDLAPEAFELCGRLTQESAIEVSGTVRQDARAPGGHELSLTGLELVQLAESYPITPKEHGPDFLLDHRHLWLRSRRPQAVLRIRHHLIRACRDYLDERGYLCVDSPILTPSACEGTTTLFETEYFGQKAYLSQSGQLYQEPAAMAFGRTYCFGPTFRAERSKTRRHLTEFWMIEPEIAYFRLDEVMDLMEDFVCVLVGRMLEECRSELEQLERDLKPLEQVQKPFPRLHYDEAVERLAQTDQPMTWGEDFGGGQETALTQQFDRPILVHHFPSQVKAFYMQPDSERPECALGADLLAPEGYGEIIGGGQRIHDLKLLQERIREHSLPEEAFRWYLDLRRYGSVPHGGFGMGIERALTWICGLHHLREAIPFPRTIYRLYP
jgi:asparaginyl-tRNA synthetase